VKSNLRSFLFLLILTIFYCIAIIITRYFFPAFSHSGTGILMSGVFFLISSLALIIFFIGNRKDPEQKIIKTFLSLSLKTVLCLIFALILFMGFKKKDSGTVILFFILYLGFTLFVVFTMLNTLKKESSKKREI
jgi:hypothetical protein